jgi:amphi-Trp domain-containing protein
VLTATTLSAHSARPPGRLSPPPQKARKLYNREDRMNNQMEITERERLSREDAAARLHALADALARHNDVEFDRGGMHFKVHVPDEVDFKLEIEFEDEEREIEIELKW